MPFPRHSLLTRHRHGVVLLILLSGGLLSFAGWTFVRQAEERRIEAEFQRRAADFARLARERLRLYREVAEQLGGFLASSGEINRGQFRDYSRRLLAEHRGIKALEWVPVVRQAERAAYEAGLSAAYGRPLRIIERSSSDVLVTAGQRPEYWPISLVEPLEGNEVTLGYDLTRVLTRPLIEAARADGRLRVSPQVRLLYTPQGERGPGVILIQPVARTAADGARVYAGFVQVVLRIADVLSSLRAGENDPAFAYVFLDETAQMPEIRVLQGGIGRQTFSAPAPLPPELALAAAGDHPGTLRTRLEFGDRDWLLAVQMNPVWQEERRTATPGLLLAGELLLTALMGLLVHVLLLRTGVIETEVDRRTSELAESRRQLASLLADMPGIAYRCQPAFPYADLFISEGVQTLTGHAPEDFLCGRLNWIDLIHSDDNASSLQHIQEAIAARRPFEIEYRVRHRDGTWRHVWERGHGVFAEDGIPRFLEGLIVDATALKRAEADKLDMERKLLEAQKLESLGFLAGGIAHDFNNILTAILGNASLTRLQLEPASPLLSPVQQIEKATRRAADLCTQMLAYAGKSSLAPGRIDLAELVNDTAALLEVTVPKGTRLVREFEPGLPAVHADASQLRQILMNLVLNAAEAIGDKPGEIVVSAHAQDFTREQLRGAVQSPDLPGGRYTVLEVRDTGAGMTPGTLARIFEPFFTTKFSGRGLGLSAVLGIVRSHRGALFVESRPGAGSSFRLLLPALPAQPAPLPPTPAPAPVLPGGLNGTVLLVDDESPVRQVAARALARHGLQVLEAVSGEEGLAQHAAHRDRINLVLLDLTMPGLGGEETLRQLRERDPQLKIIVMSGYSENETMQRCSRLGAAGFLAKPFELESLLGRLRPLLATSGGTPPGK